MGISSFLIKIIMPIFSLIVYLTVVLNPVFRSRDLIPKLICRESDLTKHLIKRTGLLSRAFCPPLLLQNSYIQTLVGYFCKHLGDVEFEREYLSMNNRGAVGIDWLTNVSSRIRKNSHILVVFPRLTGDAATVGHICRRAASKGFRVVVVNRRGHGNTQLTSPKLTSAGDPSDTKQVMEYIQYKYPEAVIVGVGYGAGCAALLSYVGEYGPTSLLRAAVFISPSYSNTKQLCQYFPRFYELMILFNLKRMLLRYSKALHKVIDVRTAIFKAWSLAEFDYQVHCKMYGVGNFETFREMNDPFRAVENITVPVMCVNSLDDPVSRDIIIPYEMFRLYPYLMLVTVAKGGHCAFHENFIGDSWADKMALTYIDGVLEFSLTCRFWHHRYGLDAKPTL